MEQPSQLSYEQQVQRLNNLGIKMDEDHPERDIQVLASIGYYKLKEFAMPFNKDSNVSIHFENLSFKNLLTRYYQDKNLRIEILHAIESIEVKLRTVFAYTLGNRFGAFGYLKFSNWCDRNKSKFEIEKRQYYFKRDVLKKVRKSRLPDLTYKKNLTDDNFPTVWLVTDALTFGDVLSLLEIMSKNNLQRISHQFDCSPNELLSWLGCLNLVRNVCCHNSDLLDFDFKTKPIIPNAYKSFIYKNQKHYSNKIAVSVFILMQLMKSVNAKYSFLKIEKSFSSVIKHSDHLAQQLGFSDHNAISKIRINS